MASISLDDLLKLTRAERFEIAMALWESLEDPDRDAAIVLTEEQKAELDRRWAVLQANPDAALSRDELVRRVHERRDTPHPI